MKTLVLAHYYTVPEVQKMADYVGDSLDLAMHAAREKPDRIVFAGVRFMAETAKILLPNTEVILPHKDSTCSLVEQTNIKELASWLDDCWWIAGKPTTHIMYINSSAEMKTLADVVVTSRNVEEICQHYHNKGHKILFSPDRNMGAYLKHEHPDWDIEYWTAVCEVHDQFKEEEILRAMSSWTDGKKYLLAHPESPLPVLKRADMIGSTSKMLQWVKDHPYKHSTIFVATEDGLLYNMKEARPELDIRLAPTYTGCQCNSCPYMKKNTPELVEQAIRGEAGVSINYLTQDVMKQAHFPIARMMEFN